jgi:hypothetical protein
MRKLRGLEGAPAFEVKIKCYRSAKHAIELI